MIYFSDITITETQGHYNTISTLMKQEASDEWMLRSRATVVPKDLLEKTGMSTNHILHFWFDGRVEIIDTDHPAVLDAPDDDIRELKNWCEDNGWKQISINKRLLEDPKSWEFWLRMYRAGIIQSDVLHTHDENEMMRLSEAYDIDKTEDNDAD